MGMRTIVPVSALRVIVNNLDLVGAAVGPHKADAILIVDVNTVLASPIRLQRPGYIRRWRSEITERARLESIPSKLSWVFVSRKERIAVAS